MESESVDNLLRILGWERGYVFEKGKNFNIFYIITYMENNVSKGY